MARHASGRRHCVGLTLQPKSSQTGASTKPVRSSRVPALPTALGNRIEIVGYENIQFSKAPNVLHGMGLAHLSKNAQAVKELTEKGMAPG
jgi:hypothetical protein